MNRTVRYCCKSVNSVYNYNLSQLLLPVLNDVQYIPKNCLKTKSDKGLKKTIDKSNSNIFGPLPKEKGTKLKQDEVNIPQQKEKSIPDEKRENMTKQYENSIPKQEEATFIISQSGRKANITKQKHRSKPAAMPKLEKVTEGRLPKPDEVVPLARHESRDTLQSENILRNKDDYLLSVENTRWRLPSSTLNIREILSSPLTSRDSDLYLVDDWQEIKKISIFEGGYKKLPTVGAILRETMPQKQKEILHNWEKRKIEELGEEAFKNYRQGLIDRGKLLHECIEMILGGDEEPNEDQLVGIEPFWESIRHVLPRISEVKVLESRVIHPTLHYQGAVDCVALFRDQLVVLDFKTSSKPKLNIKSTYDDPLQLMAYLAALNFDRLYNLPQISGAVLVIAYQSGLPAHIHHISREQCSTYWSLWLERLVQFWKINAKPIQL